MAFFKKNQDEEIVVDENGEVVENQKKRLPKWAKVLLGGAGAAGVFLLGTVVGRASGSASEDDYDDYDDNGRDDCDDAPSEE